MSRSFVTGTAYHSSPRPKDVGFYAKLNEQISPLTASLKQASEEAAVTFADVRKLLQDE
jgi:hypothetical protein